MRCGELRALPRRVPLALTWPGASMARSALLRVRGAVAAGLVTIGAAAAVSAQPVVDPNFLEFTASVDHDARDDGSEVITRYELRLYAAGATTAARTVDLGKPAPGTSGTIRLALASVLSPLPVAGTIYEVRVA